MADRRRSDDEPIERSAVAARLRVDGWTVEVVTGLRAAGVAPVLLKGPVIQRWLYADDPWERTYFDVDVLVGPDDHRRAEDVLRQLGFGEPVPAILGDWPLHAAAWRRESDGAVVDLHRCLHGTEDLPPGRVWRMVVDHLETTTIGGVEVSVPDEALRTLHVVLHVDAKDRAGSSPRVDLERARVQVDHTTWMRAGDLARELGIADEMGSRLRAVPTTASLAAALRLPATAAERVAFRRAVQELDLSAGAYAVARTGALRGRERLWYVARKVVPPASFIRRWSPLARRGGLGLAVAYLMRVGWCVARVPGALVGWRRARKAFGPSQTGPVENSDPFETPW